MDTFAENPQVTAAMERLRAAFAAPQRGTEVPWSTLEALIGCGRDEGSARAILRKFRRWLRREHGIVTFFRPSDCLRLLTDVEAAREVPTLRTRRAERQIGRGVRELSAVRESELPDGLRTIHGRQQYVLLQQRAALRRERRQFEKELPPPDQAPRRDVRPTVRLVRDAAPAAARAQA